MKVLAIDTSSKRCSVTILEDDKILINLYNDDEKTHSVKLMPMVDEAFKSTSLSLDDIGLLACSIGPGSFTGVRIGIATVKAFADAKNIPVVGVNSLESLAYNINLHDNLYENCTSSNLICTLIDAKHENVYCGLYYFENGRCNTVAIWTENLNDTILMIKNNFLNFTNSVDISNNSNLTSKQILDNKFENIIFVGDASKAYRDTLSNTFTNAIFASDEDNMQNGISVAQAGFNKYKEGDFGISTISPIYLRKSQAERALEEKTKIIPMTSKDIETISPIFNSEFDEFWNVANLKNDFANSSSKYFIAKLDDEIVGFAGILKICDEANIMNIATKVNKRHLGIGSKLLENLIVCAKDLDCTSITLEVNEHNTYAINLYEKFNFKRIGLRKKYYNNTDDAILMALNL